jgi:hypothetical protein
MSLARQAGASIAAKPIIDPVAVWVQGPWGSSRSAASFDRRGDSMGANKRQQTMAKIRREQAVREKRELKQEKREAARRAKAGQGPDSSPDGQTQLGTPSPRVE